MMMGAALISCASLKHKPPVDPPQFKAYDFPDAKYIPKVDNFLVILDASASMAEYYNKGLGKSVLGEMFTGKPKLDLAKEFLYAMNQTIPEMPLTAGLRSFGHSASVFKEPTVLSYGMTDYNPVYFEGSIDQITKAGGHSPMANAIIAGQDDLKSVMGKIAVIIVSDGKDLGSAPVQAAMEMKDTFGDDLCIYTMLIGDDPAGESLMKQIADAGGCGFASRADDFHTSSDMGDWVSKVFLGGAAKVAEMGIVYFDFDKTDIKSQYVPVLDKVAAYMKNNPAVKMEAQGHTDNSGTERYNLSLSENRAKVVTDYLVKKGIARNRLNVVGYGYFKPAAPNSTAEGRAKNRRAEFLPIR
jgi:OOP family OmpA-OmpF porin